MLQNIEKQQQMIDERISVGYSEYKEVIVCRACNGIGSYTTEELVDYHRNNYETIRHVCKHCKGDGRMVKTTTSNHYQTKSDWNEIPFVDFTGDDPFSRTMTSVMYRVDRRNYALEKKYPELAKISYDRYDEMVKKYQILDTLSKETKNG